MKSENRTSEYSHQATHLEEDICSRPLTAIRQAGYTLIELMIVVTMIGIISSIAYASFTGYTANADRGAAQADLYELAQVMERAFTEERSYDTIDLTQTLTNFSDNSPYTFSIPDATRDDNVFEIVAIADDSRDTFDLKIDERGIEGFKTHGTAAWSGTTGWDNID